MKGLAVSRPSSLRCSISSLSLLIEEKMVSPRSRTAWAALMAASSAASRFLILTSFSIRGNGLFDGLQVGQDQLGVDGLHVRARIHLAVDVDDVGVIEHADDLGDGLGLADVGEELVAQAFALRRALHDPGDVHEGHRRRAAAAASRRSPRASPAGDPAGSRRRHSVRSWRTDSSPPAPGCGSVR